MPGPAARPTVRPHASAPALPSSSHAPSPPPSPKPGQTSRRKTGCGSGLRKHAWQRNQGRGRGWRQDKAGPKKKAFCKHGSPGLRRRRPSGPGRHNMRIGQSQHRPFSGAATHDDCKQSTDGAKEKLKRRPPHATRNKRPLADAAGPSRPDRTRSSRFPQVRHTVSQRAPPTWKTRETR